MLSSKNKNALFLDYNLSQSRGTANKNDLHELSDMDALKCIVVWLWIFQHKGALQLGMREGAYVDTSPVQNTETQLHHDSMLEKTVILIFNVMKRYVFLAGYCFKRLLIP